MRSRLPALIVFATLLALFACARPRPFDDASEMKAGLHELYEGGQPQKAAEHFRKVLAVNPDHYGATYQLAVALERAGRADEARPLWGKVLRIADATGDSATSATAKQHLGLAAAAPSAAPDESAQLMNQGVDLLYLKGKPADAEPIFRRVLAAQPSHYGATYQLAESLTRQKKDGEARPLWESVLKMAQSYNDPKTADTARRRLAGDRS